MDTLNSIFKLRELLRKMERDVGLDDLSTTERDIFLAAFSLTTRQNKVVESLQIRRHELVKHMAQATYHRALRALLDVGLLEHAGKSKAKTYVVRSDLVKK